MEQIKPIVELELYLIRHGESMCNAGYGRDNLTLTEAHDPVLTEKGILQAQAAGKEFSDTDFSAVYSSALFRAVQTATEIIKAQPTQKPLFILPEICELGLSREYKGSFDQIKIFNPDAQLAPGIEADSPLLCYTVHEKEEETFARAAKALEYIRTHHSGGEKVAVVSHAAFLTYFIFHIMKIDKIPFYDLDFYNTGVTKVVFYKPGTNKWGDVVFKCINDTSHYKLM